MAQHSNIRLKWVWGHETCSANRIADQLAWTDANLSAENPDNFREKTLCKNKLRIKMLAGTTVVSELAQTGAKLSIENWQDLNYVTIFLSFRYCRFGTYTISLEEEIFKMWFHISSVNTMLLRNLSLNYLSHCFFIWHSPTWTLKASARLCTVIFS